MALIHLDHVPETIQVNVPLNIIIPDPGKIKGKPIRDRKVLYLLHGLSDDASAWQRYSSIETVAKDYGLVVVMPSVGRSFYTDQPNGQKYFTYIVEELPRYLDEVFHLAPKREDTYIAGISMGGYGAFKAAFLHPELYAAAVSFSGVLSLEIFRTHPNDSRKPEFEFLFGDLTKLFGSEHDPLVWLKNAVQSGVQLPELYVACGYQDDLYPLNRIFQAACQSAGVPVHYHEEDGKHDWYFWDTQIKRVLAELLGPLPA